MLKGAIKLEGDKSISHRVLILATLAKGDSTIKNLSYCKDVQRTINILKNCGVAINKKNNETIIKGGKKLRTIRKRFYCGNSGSTARFMLGFLPTQGISGILYGDKSLSKRPMNRITQPLQNMNIQFTTTNNTLPISFNASTPIAHDYTLTVPSAQVKTSLIFASLVCKKKSDIKDFFNTRDHTERLLKYLGYKEKTYSKFTPKGFEYTIPGDISSAAFLISAALLIPKSNLIIKDVLYNKTRTGYIRVLKKMGGNIKISNKQLRHNEMTCDIHTQYTKTLKAITLLKEDISAMIDEIPIFALIASYAKGKSIIQDIGELRYKESDRIKAIVSTLQKLNVDIKEKNEGFIIQGPNKLYNTSIKTFGDHRIAIMHEIAKLILTNKLVKDTKREALIATSFPKFYDILGEIYV